MTPKISMPRSVSANLRNPIIRIALTFVLILIAGLLLLIIYIHNAISSIPKANATHEISGPISGYANLVAKGPLQYNESRYIMEFGRVDYSIDNVSNISAYLDVYTTNPAPRIYVLNVQSYCVDCFIGSSLYAALNSSLSKYGLILNKSTLNGIDISDIGQIPRGSTIIIPSGLMPLVLFPNSTSATYGCKADSNASLETLLQNGDTILYVGRSLASAVTCSGQVVQTPYGAAVPIWSIVNDTIQLHQPNTTANFTNPLHLTNSTFRFAYVRNESFGTATAIQYLNGSFVALPNYPSIGWNDSFTLLAADIAKTIASRFWIPVLAYGNLSISGSGAPVSASYLTVFTKNSLIQNGPKATGLVNSTYSLITIIANNSHYSKEFDIPFRVNYTYSGILEMPGTVALGQQVQLGAQAYISRSGAIIAYTKILNSSLDAQNLTVQFGRLGPTPVLELQGFGMPSGYYIANLTDQNGRAYASSMFYLAQANITPISLDFKNGSFTFSATSNNQSMNNIPYSISINGAYNTTGMISGGVINYTLPRGTVTNYGNETFRIAVLDNRYSISSEYASPTGGIPTFYIEVAIELLVVLLIAKFIVPPNVEEYYIDVPDTKPVQAQTLRETADTFVDVFDKVNNYYHWKNMPLSVDEIKTGISNYVRYGNTRVGITARNAYAVLSKLEAKGIILEAGDYYAPKKWIDASNCSIEYLVVYRKLRDFCVANAMLFTELGSTQAADMIVTNKSVQNYIKIYTKDTGVKDINIIKGARSFIVFIDEESMLQFTEKLHSSYGQNAEILKMAISYGSIILIDTDHLENLKL